MKVTDNDEKKDDKYSTQKLVQRKTSCASVMTFCCLLIKARQGDGPTAGTVLLF
jgi:hypothetical protein